MVLRVAGIVGLFLAVMVCGCQFQQPRSMGPVIAGVPWTSVQQMGIGLICPPSEDVLVGDVYVRAEPDYLWRTSRWGSLPIANDIRSDYEHRMVFPRTPLGDQDGRGGLDGWTQPRREGGMFRDLDTNEDEQYLRATRLRLVAMPDWVGYGYEDPSVRLYVPAEALTAGAAMGQKFSSISFSWVSAEGYAVPQHVVVDSMLKKGEKQYYLPAEGMFANLTAHNKGQGNTVFVTVITEVIYGRVLDIGIMYENELNPAMILQHSMPLPGAPNAAASSRDFDLRMRQLMDQDVPGGKLRYLGASAHSVSVRRIYERPVAVLIRGITFKIDLGKRHAGLGYEVIGTEFSVVG